MQNNKGCETVSKSDSGHELQPHQPPPDKPYRQCDVVIVGAGLSGLGAAQLLSASSVDVLVLEAQDRVGGRTLTIHPDEVSPQAFIDHGGQWVSPGQTSLMALHWNSEYRWSIPGIKAL
jgi:monoamine oxidase